MLIWGISGAPAIAIVAVCLCCIFIFFAKSNYSIGRERGDVCDMTMRPHEAGKRTRMSC